MLRYGTRLCVALSAQNHKMMFSNLTPRRVHVGANLTLQRPVWHTARAASRGRYNQVHWLRSRSVFWVLFSVLTISAAHVPDPGGGAFSVAGCFCAVCFGCRGGGSPCRGGGLPGLEGVVPVYRWRQLGCQYQLGFDACSDSGGVGRVVWRDRLRGQSDRAKLAGQQLGGSAAGSPWTTWPSW